MIGVPMTVTSVVNPATEEVIAGVPETPQAEERLYRHGGIGHVTTCLPPP
jgi:hypothetical protein